MVQDIVVGTLSTLSTLVSPLAPATPMESQTYRYEIEASPSIQASCQELREGLKAGKKSTIDLRLESGVAGSFTATLKIGFCGTEGGYQSALEKVSLPVELLDDAFLLKLPVDASYVVSGVPSDKKPGFRNRVKITRLAPVGELNPVRVEWIPDSGFETEHRPLTIWIAKAANAFAGVHGFDAKALRWRRIEFAYKNPQLRRPFAMTGELSRIEQER